MLGMFGMLCVFLLHGSAVTLAESPNTDEPWPSCFPPEAYGRWAWWEKGYEYTQNGLLGVIWVRSDQGASAVSTRRADGSFDTWSFELKTMKTCLQSVLAVTTSVYAAGFCHNNRTVTDNLDPYHLGYQLTLIYSVPTDVHPTYSMALNLASRWSWGDNLNFLRVDEQKLPYDWQDSDWHTDCVSVEHATGHVPATVKIVLIGIGLILCTLLVCWCCMRSKTPMWRSVYRGGAINGEYHGMTDVMVAEQAG